jgi:hypothetical protein
MGNRPFWEKRKKWNTRKARQEWDKSRAALELPGGLRLLKVEKARQTQLK